MLQATLRKSWTRSLDSKINPKTTPQYQNYLRKKPSNPQDEDAQLSKAIEQSINAAKGKNISLEPLNP